MRHATILAASGDHKASDKHWEVAQPAFEQAWENKRFLARSHEGVMLYSYRMLGALHLGDVPEARRYLVCAMEFRDQVIAENTARVEKHKEAIERGRKLGATSDDEALVYAAVEDRQEEDMKQAKDETQRQEVEAVRGDSFTLMGSVADTIGKNRRQVELEEDVGGYANYANPLTSFLTYLFLKTQGTGKHLTDPNDAKRELDELSVYVPNNSVVRWARENNTLVRDDPFLGNSVFVFFETGMSPRQVERKIDIPFPNNFKYTKYLSYLGVAWPELVMNTNSVYQLRVSGGGREVLAEPLANFDSITKQSFDDEWSGVLARQIAQSIAVAAINVGLNIAIEKTLKEEWQKVLAKVASAALCSAMIGAETRSWELLPKRVLVTRLDIPGDRKLTLSFPDGTWRQDITLGAGDVMAVWVKSTSPWQPAPVVTQFKFK